MSRFRLIKGKKGTPMYVLLVVMAGIVALSFCWYIVVNKTQGAEKTLGENQFALLNVYQFGEEFRLYLEQAGKYSAYYAIHNLSGSAGIYGVSICGSFNGYQLWNLKYQECFPTKEQINESFISQFSSMMDQYLQPYLTPPGQLDYQLDFIQTNPLAIMAIPYNKLDFAISSSNYNNKIHPNIKAITIGDSVDLDMIRQDIQQHEAARVSAGAPPGGTP